jgi:hypothetical protein
MNDINPIVKKYCAFQQNQCSYRFLTKTINWLNVL